MVNTLLPELLLVLVEEVRPLIRDSHDETVELEWRDLMPFSAPVLCRDSQWAMDSRVSWQRLRCFMTSQHGMKIVKISISIMDTAILGSC
jgi:hypothetical protein